MFETHICVVGNVLTAPEWRRTSASGRLVTSFKVAAGTRRLDRATGNWVDGNGLRVRVSCWRDLAGGVASSIMVGDPVIVYGQIYTRDWVDKDGIRRTLYEMEAQAVGHNLARGRARFARNKPVSASEIEPDPTEPVRLGGEDTRPAFGLPTGLDPRDPLRQLDDSTFDEPLTLDEPLGGLSDWGEDPARPDGLVVRVSDDEQAEEEDAVDEESADDAEAVEHRPEDDADHESGDTEPGTAGETLKSRRRRRTPAGV